jgi:hypothetical protein
MVSGMAADVEGQIRSYLDSLGRKAVKPRRVVDVDAVNAVKEKLRSATDAIEKLKLYGELEAAERPKVETPADDRDALEAGFVANAKAWAATQGIPVSAFERLKVPSDVLRKAGFAVSASGRRSVRPVSSRRGGTRAPRLDLQDVKVVIGKLPATWTLKALSEKLDRDTATTRNYVKRLVSDGFLTVVGEDSSKQGRPAKIYSVNK